MTTFHVITLFPESLESYLNSSIVKRAQQDGFISLKYYNPRDFALPGKVGAEMTYSERRVDNRPYGGGPGMVMEAMPIVRAIDQVMKVIEEIAKTSPKVDVVALEEAKKNKAISKKLKVSKKNKQKPSKPKVKIIFFSPSGKMFTNVVAESWKKYSDIILVCGRYEGIDARVKKMYPMTDISIGPFTLTGGELPAMIVIDAVTRRIPGVLGDNLSIEEERVASPDVYTRPEVIEYKGKNYKVPKILLGGHHAKIEEWKQNKLKKTKGK